MLPIDYEDEGYRFYKTLNEDIELKPDEHNQWDMTFENGDIINLTGHDSLRNAICIAIMTRYKELSHNQLYNEFGCRVHELIKANKSRMVEYKIELFIEDVLTHMRRVKKVNYVNITDNPKGNTYKYLVEFNVTSISDKTVMGRVNL
ncbi:MAG: hypothetical protein IJ104_00535 [Methanobrevibacter sp.]|nr:hypothetical protein [Methanobrevibacter sp.]